MRGRGCRAEPLMPKNVNPHSVCVCVFSFLFFLRFLTNHPTWRRTTGTTSPEDSPSFNVSAWRHDRQLRAVCGDLHHRALFRCLTVKPRRSRQRAKTNNTHKRTHTRASLRGDIASVVYCTSLLLTVISSKCIVLFPEYHVVLLICVLGVNWCDCISEEDYTLLWLPLI